MADTLDQILSILNNSVTGGQLPTAGSIGAGDYRIFYNSANQRFERILNVNTSENQQNWSPVNFGAIPTALQTTTNQEVVDYLNLVGFAIGNNSLKIIQCLILVSNQFHRVQYLYKPNSAGSYGTTAANPIVFSDLYELTRVPIFVDESSDEVVVTDLGDIGSDTISAWINANASYNIDAGNLYLFKAVQNSVNVSYLYIGIPQVIGNGANLVTEDDFLQVEEQRAWIDGYDVRKVIGYSTLNAWEVGDRFHGWNGDTFLAGKVVGLPFDVNDTTKVKLAVNQDINPF